MSAEVITSDLTHLPDQSHDDTTRQKSDLLANPLHATLYQVLKELKPAQELSKPTSTESLLAAQNQNLSRLDAILRMEGVLDDSGDASPPSDSPPRHNADYYVKMNEVKRLYQEELHTYQKKQDYFRQRVYAMLQEQSRFRPIRPGEAECLVAAIQYQLCGILFQLKESTLQLVLALKDKYINYKRREPRLDAFAKQTLNDYFDSHRQHPYPSSEEKIELAKKCSITVSQVNNFLAGKRLRTRRKAEEDAALGPSAAIAITSPRSDGDHSTGTSSSSRQYSLSPPYLPNSGERQKTSQSISRTTSPPGVPTPAQHTHHFNFLTSAAVKRGPISPSSSPPAKRRRR